MSNSIVLYSAASGVEIASDSNGISDFMTYNKLLKPREVEKILLAVNNQLYDMAAEYLWSRTIGNLKKEIFQLGNDFVAEMLDRPNGDVESISEYEIIVLAADLGIINKTAKMKFLHFSEDIQHFRSENDDDEDFPKTTLNDMAYACVKYVLGYEAIEYEVPFISFRDKLKSESIKSDSEIYMQIKSSPYFYKKTVTKALINLSRSTQNSAERENSLANLSYLIPEIWEDLSSEDRWSIGRAYAQANSDGDENFSKALKSILIRVKGFDYVPENLRSNSFIIAAKDLLSAHYGMNNFYREPAYAKVLCEMGTSIPVPAFSTCMSSILACKLGNGYGISIDAQPYLDRLLDRITDERWRYYLGTDLPKDDVILYKLAYQTGGLKEFKNIIKKYCLNEIRFTNETIAKLIQDIVTENFSAANEVVVGMYKAIS